MNDGRGNRALVVAALALGLFSFASFLAWSNTADFDIWARLSLGALIWKGGSVPAQDVFAFTKTLPAWIDHEWGTGVFYYGILKFMGPGGLLAWKILAGCAALIAAMAAAWRRGVRAPIVMLLAVPCAWGLVPGYTPVARSHTVTYLFFASILFLLQVIRDGKRWPFPVIIAVMLLWTNMHGGFVAGLGLIGVHTLGEFRNRKIFLRMVILCAVCALATLINPWGWKFWPPLIMALRHARPNIPEWQPISFFANDVFTGFRVLFAMALVILAVGWRKCGTRDWASLGMLALTAFLVFRSRRHAPFFAIMAPVALGPFLQAIYQAYIAAIVPKAVRPRVLLVAGYTILTVYTMTTYLANTTFNVAAPIGLYPAREVEILSVSGLRGNLVVPFKWGSYAMWRLYPRVRISIDGRYEAVYPEETFVENLDFNFKRGDWSRLLKNHTVDFVILDLNPGAVTLPADVVPFGFTEVWREEEASSLLVRNDRVAEFKSALTGIDYPPPMSDPLNAKIPAGWLADGNSEVAESGS